MATNRTSPHPWGAVALIITVVAIITVVIFAKASSASSERAERRATEETVPRASGGYVAPTSVPQGRQVRQLPDCYTPCSMEISEIRDLYTDGESIKMLPPGWDRRNAITYLGRGHLIVEGGNIRSGRWEFWSADPKRVALIRVFAFQ